MEVVESGGNDQETFLECAFGTVRIQGETALVFVGGTLEVWRGPFAWTVGEFVEVEGPHGRLLIVSPGDVVSSLRLRPVSG